MSDTKEKAKNNEPAPQVNDEITAAVEQSAAGNCQNPAAADQIKQLKQELDEAKDQVLRVRAEFANYQKRSKQQADADRIYSIGSLARDLLDPLDNLERAIEALRARRHRKSPPGSTWSKNSSWRSWANTASSRFGARPAL